MLQKPNNAPTNLTGNTYFFVIISIVGLGLLAYTAILISQDDRENNVIPISIRLALYDNVTIVKGNSRVVEVLFYSGDDDRGSKNFKIVNQR